RIYLLDSQDQPVAPNEVGEICVASLHLARGYLHRPDLTARQFVPDPFAAEPRRRMYRTGDLARYAPDGNLEFVGRADHEVKIRGFRVELGEIEAALMAHEEVQTAAVVTQRFGTDLRLVAYVAQKSGCELRALTLREHLRRQLPSHMIPAAFIIL